MKSGFTNDAVIVATKQQVSCKLGEEVAILSMKNSVYYGLDPVGARIWQLLQQPTSMGAIRDLIVEEYDVTPQQVESDLRELLEKLFGEGLVELAPDSR
ncbi:MAG TPA: PqqD family protein [Candidatus Acidoferrales bacterium]|nr:PqqD family protein [Candidatus Acidoferrales bacterium]